MPILLEIAVFTLQGAIMAEEAGAHRIEFCENAGDGGTTPSYGALKKIREIVSIPVFPIIRPRGGDFVYTESEFEVLCEDILVCKEFGFEGIVTGILHEDGTIHTERMKRVVGLAGNMSVTFHRAFDRCKHPIQALEELIDCGCDRILSSGQNQSVMNGLSLLAALNTQAKERIIIMPGSGLNAGNVLEILDKTKCREIHTAARKSYSQGGVFSPASMQEKLQFIGVDQEEIKAILSKISS